jgi:hypothetical protein
MHALYNGGASDAEVKVTLAIPAARALILLSYFREHE